MKIALLLIPLLLCFPAWAQKKLTLSYGPFPEQVLDLYQAPSNKPTPMIMIIHGGGFRYGDKSGVAVEFYEKYFPLGVSVALINYRHLQQSTLPEIMIDGARALQYLRLSALKLNLDPHKFAVEGVSSGAAMALWLALHDDLRKKEIETHDPVLHQSSRVKCVLAHAGQTSFDPNLVKKNLGEKIARAIENLYDKKIKGKERTRLYRELSPLDQLTHDDPPLYLSYGKNNGKQKHIHHLRFGELLAEKAKKIGHPLTLTTESGGPEARALFLKKCLE